MRLVLCGGVQGVGKTTLISRLKSKFKRKITLLDPGKLFRRYFYNKRIKTPEEIEELITDKIKGAPGGSTMVIHWHYGVRRPSGYIPQISFERLRRIAKSGKIDKVVLLLVEAPADIVYSRRLKDRKIKKSRAISLFKIREEVRMEKKFLKRHAILFSRILGKNKVIVFRIANTRR